MSRDYSLICKDCRVELHFGKVYWLDENHNPLEDTTFAGVHSWSGKKWHRRDEYFGKVMEKFLILHRNHHLMFVPEGVDEFMEDELGFIEALEADELLKAPVDPEVDWHKERSDWIHKLGKANDGRYKNILMDTENSDECHE